MPENTRNEDRPTEIETLLGIGKGTANGPLRRRKWPIALLLLALLGAGGAYLLLGSRDSTNGLRYRTEAASREDITVIVTATGTVEPTNKVEISSELSGIIRTVAVDFNSTVKVGQVLAELDTDKLQATVDSSRARLAAAKAHVAEAKATVTEKEKEFARKQALAERNFSSAQDLQAARAAHERARAALVSAEADVAATAADLKLNETNLGKACICSPIDGVVLGRNVDPGQVVASSLQAPVLFTIAEDLSKMEVQVDVDEADVGTVREGQTAAFSVDAYPDRRFRAAIKELRFGSEVVQGVVTYKAVLTTDNAELLLRPGMTATAEITVQEAKDALTVSNEALRFTPPAADTVADNRGFLKKIIPGPPSFRPASRSRPTGPSRELWVLKDGVAAPIQVKIGATDGARTAIVDGPLEAGQQVIVDILAAPK